MNNSLKKFDIQNINYIQNTFKPIYEKINKTILSLSFVQIIVLCIIIFVIISILSLKKIKFACFGCSKGSWWYKCLEGTGYGTASCEAYKFTYNNIKRITEILNIIPENIKKLRDIFKKLLIDILDEIKNIKNKFINLIKIPSLSIPKINKPDINCGFSFMNKNINPCGPIENIVHSLIDGMNSASSGLLSVLVVSFNTIFNQIKNFLTNITSEIFKIFEDIIDKIKNPIIKIVDIIEQIYKEIEDLYKNIISMDFINIILFNITSLLMFILPIRLVNAISLSIFTLFTIIVLPIVGFLSIIFSILLIPFKILLNLLSYIIPSAILNFVGIILCGFMIIINIFKNK